MSCTLGRDPVIPTTCNNISLFPQLMLVCMLVTLLSCQHLWKCYATVYPHLVNVKNIVCPLSKYFFLCSIYLSLQVTISVLSTSTLLLVWHFLHLNCRLFTTLCSGLLSQGKHIFFLLIGTSLGIHGTFFS